jgi:hypothetical protein
MISAPRALRHVALILGAAVLAVSGSSGCAGPEEGSIPTAGAPTSGSRPAPASTTGPATAEELRRAALRSEDLGPDWTARPIPRSQLLRSGDRPCQRRYSTDSKRAAVYGVGLGRSGQPRQVVQTLVSYQPGTADAALGEIRDNARTCPRYRQRAAGGRVVTVDLVIDSAPPAYGDDRLLVVRRASASGRALYSVFLVVRDGNVLTTVSTAAETPQQAGELAGLVAAPATRRIADARLR